MGICRVAMPKLLIVTLLVSLSFALNAKSGPPAGAAKRGGQGFLFEDFSQFSNPAQRAHFRGFAVGIAYETISNSEVKALTPSFVWGKGRFGFGGFASRIGSDLSAPQSSTDLIGGALGFGLSANRLTLGAGYIRSIDEGQNSNGVLSVSANLNGLGGNGFHLGAGATTTMQRATRDIQSGILAVGWGFGRAALEASYSIADFKDPAANYKLAGYLNWEGTDLFLGAGFGYDKPAGATFGSGRLGFKFSKIDLSAFGSKSFATGSNPVVGAMLRIKF